MSLTNFFRINLPYGIAKNKEGKWTAFNREYLPLGYNDKSFQDHSRDFIDGKYGDLPIYTEYRKFTKDKLSEIISLSASSDEDETGETSKIWFYNDRTNPTVSNDWTKYMQIIKILSYLERKD